MKVAIATVALAIVAMPTTTVHQIEKLRPVCLESRLGLTVGNFRSATSASRNIATNATSSSIVKEGVMAVSVPCTD